MSLYYKELGLLPPGIDVSSQFDASPSDIAVDCPPEVAGFILHNQLLKQKVVWYSYYICGFYRVMKQHLTSFASIFRLFYGIIIIISLILHEQAVTCFVF